jgi:hypothetical protein
MKTFITSSPFKKLFAGRGFPSTDHVNTQTYFRWCTVNRKKLPNIKCFVYVFPCDFAKKRNEVEIYGTGGMILQNMKNLLQCLPGLERLELVDLQLDGMDGMYVNLYC